MTTEDGTRPVLLRICGRLGHATLVAAAGWEGVGDYEREAADGEGFADGRAVTGLGHDLLGKVTAG